jgi:tetratricopeptide (TPR) repeat protein
MNLIEEAINNFELAIKNNPNYIDPIINLGYLYYSMDKFELALNLFKKAEILSPNKKEYLYSIAKLHERLKNQEESIKYFSHLIKLYPYDSNSLNDRAVIYIDKKMFHEALQDLNVAIQLNPEDVE